MAPKRPPAKAESSSASSSSDASSSDEAGGVQEEVESVSSKKNLPQKNPTNPPEPINPSPNPPAASSSDDEEEDDDDDVSGDNKELGGGDKKQEASAEEEEEDEEEGSGDEEESDSEDEKTKNKPSVDTQPKMQYKLVPKPTQEPSGSGSSDDSGSDSDSGSSEEAPAPVSAPRPSRSADPSIKPISSKPMDAPPKPTKPAASPAPAPSQDRESLKRKHDAVEPEQETNGGLKRQLFQRLWSLEDEIVLLNGLLKYRSKEGALPSTQNMEGFRNFIIGSLQVEVSSSQLVNKLRSLKKKFDTNVARTKNGADPKFTKDHERDVYELSKKVWGVKKISSEDADANGSDSEENEESDTDMAIVPKPNEQLDSSKHENIVKVNDKTQYPYLWEAVTKMADQHPCGVAIRRAMTMLKDSKAKSMEEKLKWLKTIELKQHLRRIDLNKETVKLIVDAIARSE